MSHEWEVYLIKLVVYPHVTREPNYEEACPCRSMLVHVHAYQTYRRHGSVPTLVRHSQAFLEKHSTTTCSALPSQNGVFQCSVLSRSCFPYIIA